MIRQRRAGLLWKRELELRFGRGPRLPKYIPGFRLRQYPGQHLNFRRGVTRSQPQIHDSPRNQLNSRSIGDGEARSSRQRE
jgi:hypothetical protein